MCKQPHLASNNVDIYLGHAHRINRREGDRAWTRALADRIQTHPRQRIGDEWLRQGLPEQRVVPRLHTELAELLLP